MPELEKTEIEAQESTQSSEEEDQAGRKNVSYTTGQLVSQPGSGFSALLSFISVV